MIDKGRIRQFGTPEELYETPADLFVANFIGSPRINLFQVEIEGRNFVYGSERWEIPDKYLGLVKGKKDVIVGVRPEDINIEERKKQRAFPANLIMSEKLGNTVVLNVKWQDKIVRVSLPRMKQYESANDLWIEFDRHKLLLFDPLTEGILRK